MNQSLTLSTFCSFLVFATGALAAQPLLVEDGRARAEIVIADKPPRTTLLAAQELQTYLEKISGAKLAILNEPSGKAPVKIYIGRSDHTDRLKITAEDLKYGAYRIVSGDDWLVLMGDDTEFTPIEPWPRSNNDWVSGRVHTEWDKITGAAWGNPLSQLRKHYTGSAGFRCRGVRQDHHRIQKFYRVGHFGRNRPALGRKRRRQGSAPKASLSFTGAERRL